MALKALMTKRKIDDAKSELEKLRQAAEDFAKREANIEQSISEAGTDEEKAAVEDEINKFEAEKAENAEAQKELEDKIAGLEDELRAEEAKQEAPAEVAPEPTVEAAPAVEREVKRSMTKRDKMFGESINERDAFFQREDVKAWLGEVRSAMQEKRALTNVGLTIPSVFLGVLRENVLYYSKLYKHVNVRAFRGDGRLTVMGTVPEAVWTECCAWINELDLSFYDTEVDCNKVAGFFAVCNAALEDSDLDLAAEIMTALGQAIGKALDKAIIFGTGNKMPLGIFTRLAQTEEPSTYPATARPWADLHQSNVKTIADTATGVALFQQILLNSAAAKGKYARGPKVWAMNETTYTFLKAQALSINASGAIVSGMEGTMPVVGGVVEVLDFIPDYMIFGGYTELYLLAERSSEKFAQSEHYRFLQDQTVFKGTARYDGVPVIAEAFVAIGINGTTPSAENVAFAPDKANEVQGITLDKTVATVKATKTIKLTATTTPVAGAVTWATSDVTYATVEDGVVTGVAAGTATITATSNGAVASCVVTVAN